MTRPMRRLSIIGVCLIWLSLILRLGFDVQGAVSDGAAFIDGLLRFLSAFSTLANIFIAGVVSVALSRSTSPLARAVTSPLVMACAAVYIIVMAVVFALYLADVATSTGLNRIVGGFLHGVNPLFYLGYWFLLTPKRRLQWRHVLIWPIPVLGYSAVVLLRGALTGQYTYWFMDPAKIGWTGVWAYSALMLAFFVVAGLLVVIVDRYSPWPLDSRRPSVTPTRRRQ